MFEPEALMQLAIEKARAGIAAGQTPFGCAIATTEVLAVSHNTVWFDTDPTAHAEINALREAARQAGSIHLDGAIVATTCEPCPMCMSALHWARVGRVYFGATIADAVAAGFNELQLPSHELLRQGGSAVQLHVGLLDQECRELFDHWRRKAGRAY